MKIIDFHTHTFPDKIARAALDSLQHSSESKAHTDGTVSGLRNSMKEAGIDISIVLPVVTNPSKSSSMNNYAARLNESFEKTGVFSIGGIHPQTPDLKNVIKEAAGLGLKGLKLHPDYYKISFNDIRMKRVIDYASENGLFIITHAGMDIGLYPPICCTLDSIIDVLEDVQPQTLILAHMGGWMNWQEVTERLAPVMKEYNKRFRSHTKKTTEESSSEGEENTGNGKGIYLDTAFSIGDIEWLNPASHKDYHQMSDEQFIKMVDSFGSDRILFATDSPWAEQKDYVNRVKNMGIDLNSLQNIYHKNAEDILGLRRFL